jgi:hypothetical protein
VLPPRVVVAAPAPDPAPPPAPTPAPTPAPAPLDPAFAPDAPPLDIPRTTKPGRRKNVRPKHKRQTTTTARTFTFPVALLARLERFGIGQAERTGQRFNYSAYLTLILDADLAKRGF